MKPALDIPAALSLVVQSRHTEESSAIVRSLNSPIAVSLPLRFQMENALLRDVRAGSRTSAAAFRLWLWLWQQGVLFEDDADLPLAYRLASSWHARRSMPPPSGEMIQPALAIAGRCTHFISFNPFSRNRAAEAGLEVLPARLS